MRTYSVPRRFGLGTLLVVTLAFSGLSGLFRWLEWGPAIALTILAFIGIISVAQFFFDRSPRLASAVTGSVVFVVVASANWLIESRDPEYLVMALLWSGIWGFVAGYVTGVMVGSIFLMMAGVSALFHAKTEKESR